MGWTTQQLLDLRNAPEHSTNLSLAASIMVDILNCPFLTCMLEIGRREEPSKKRLSQLICVLVIKSLFTKTLDPFSL